MPKLLVSRKDQEMVSGGFLLPWKGKKLCQKIYLAKGRVRKKRGARRKHGWSWQEGLVRGKREGHKRPEKGRKALPSIPVLHRSGYTLIRQENLTLSPSGVRPCREDISASRRRRDHRIMDRGASRERVLSIT